MSRADHYPPVVNGRPLMDGPGAAAYLGVPRGTLRSLAARHGILAEAYRHRRAYYTPAQVARLARLAGVFDETVHACNSSSTDNSVHSAG